MATDLERLVVQLSADVKQYQNQINKAHSLTNQRARQIENRFAKMQKNINSTFSGTLGKGLVGGLAAGFSVQAAKELLDGATRMRNALKTTGLEGEALQKVYGQLYASAQKNAAPVESLVSLYTKLSLVSGELGVSQEQLLQFTDQIGTALRAGGVDAQQASGALLQLSQALGSGVVRAEEFNSILEGAPIILQQAAAGLKEAEGSVAKLRTLMLDGRLSSKAFFDAFIAGAPATAEKLQGAETSISQAFVRLQNVLQDSAMKFDAATGASKDLAEFMNGPLTQAIEEIAKILTGLSTGPIPQFFNGIGEGIDWVVQKFADLGAALGTDRLGGNPYIGPGRIQDRIDSAFSGTTAPARTTQKTGRLGTSATNPAIKKVTLDDYEVPADSKKKAGKSEAVRAAEKAAQDLDRAIAGQTSVAVDAVTQLLGMHEKKNTGTINAFLKRGGVDLNAATTAWCAAFVNSALAQVGVTGSGSQIATNFANWGTGVNASDAQRGDVLVQMRGKQVGETGGHVGLSTGQMRFREGILELQMISGNASNQVQEEWVRASDTIVRRATDAMQLPPEALRNLSEEAQAAMKASEDALKRQQQTAEQMGSILQTAISGLTTALADGKIEANEMLSIVLQIAQQLLSMQALKGGGGGGIFGSILSGLLGGFSEGGFTGVGAKKTPAGIVHKGEYVIPADKVAKMGLGNLERLMAGYANGGAVGGSSFAIPAMDRIRRDDAGLNNPVTYVVNAPINAPGADKAELARLRREVKLLGKSMPSMIDSRQKEREQRKTRASYYGMAR